MNIFDDRGRIRADVQVPDDRRPQYDALVAAQTACEAAETAEKIADQKVAECVRIHDQTVHRIPRQTHVELVKETFGLV